MRVKFQIDADGRFRRACDKLAEKMKMSAAQIVTQNALDIAERCFDTAPRVDSQKIWDEIRTAKASALRADGMMAIPASGPGVAGRTTKAGKFVRYRQNRQLQSIHLIVNAIRGEGRGLYGKDMMRYAGHVTRSRRGGSGSIKIAFLPAIQKLMPKAKFKFSWSTKAKGIKRWPGSYGWGSARPAAKSPSPVAEFTVKRSTRRRDRQSYVDGILSRVVGAAVDWKRSKVIERAERIQAPVLAEFNR